MAKNCSFLGKLIYGSFRKNGKVHMLEKRKNNFGPFSFFILKANCQQVGAYLVEIDTADENNWITQNLLKDFSEYHYTTRPFSMQDYKKI